MILDRRLTLVPLLAASCLLAACGGGGKGSSAAPPTTVTATARDQAVTVTWKDDPSVQYWIVIGPPGTTPDNFDTITGAYAYVNVTSPYTISAVSLNGSGVGLVNGKDYAVTMNARINGGPGGPSSTPVTVSPRPMGSTWQVDTPLISSIDNAAVPLYAGAYGLPLYNNGGTLYSNGHSAQFEFVGHDGIAFYSTLNSDGATYFMQPVPTGIASGNDLTGVAYGAAIGFLAVGTNGQASLSLDGLTWVPQSSGATASFRAIAATAASGFIVVGDACSVYATGTGGTTQTTAWVNYSAGFTSASAFSTACASSHPPSLRAVVNGAGYQVAAGTQGTLAYSGGYGTTAANWLAITPAWPSGVTPASVNLNGLLFGPVYETQSTGIGQLTYLWVAVGDYTDSGGVVRPLILYTNAGPTVNSAGAVVWTSWVAATLPANLSGSLRSIAAATDPVNAGLTQLVAVGDNGLVLRDVLQTPATDSSGNITNFITSTPAQSWSVVGVPTAANLNAIVPGNFGLQAIGSAGTRIYSF